MRSYVAILKEADLYSKSAIELNDAQISATYAEYISSGKLSKM